MKFGKATIESASDAREFDVSHDNGPPNVVTRSQYHSFQPDAHLALLGLQRTQPAFGRHCRAYSRWRLSEPEREVVRKYRPAGEARYWTISDTEKRVAFEKELYGRVLEKWASLYATTALSLACASGSNSPKPGAAPGRCEAVQLHGLHEACVDLSSEHIEAPGQVAGVACCTRGRLRSLEDREHRRCRLRRRANPRLCLLLLGRAVWQV